MLSGALKHGHSSLGFGFFEALSLWPEKTQFSNGARIWLKVLLVVNIENLFTEGQP